MVTKATTPQRHDVATYQVPVCRKSTAAGNAMPCRLLIDTTGTTYTFYEISRNIRKQSKRKQKPRRQIEREKKKNERKNY